MTDTCVCALLSRAGPTRSRPPILGQRRRLVLSFGGLVAFIGALMATVILPPRPILLWNATASSPVGLYLLGSAGEIAAGDHVAAWAPDWARTIGADRLYIPLNVPLVKRVAAAAGDEICAHGQEIFLNGAPAAKRRTRDALGRPMPSWKGCIHLRKGEYFLFDPSEPDAFDGRYFGISESGRIIGRAKLIWPA